MLFRSDPAYQLALAMGTDIYFVYAGQVTNGKASVSVKAYETTTGRLLGTETGYSATRPGSSMEPLVEEAVSDAVDKVLQRVRNYWAADLKSGIQYRLVLRFDKGFSPQEIDKLQDKIGDLVEGNFTKSKENVITGQTMDLNVWAQRDEYSRSAKIVSKLNADLAGAAQLRKININRKLIILGVERP